MRLVEFDLEVVLGSFKLSASGKLGTGLHCVVGPNGSGKTTLLRALTGVARLSRGYVKYVGVSRAVYIGGVEVPPNAKALDVALLGRSKALWPPSHSDVEAVRRAARVLGIEWGLDRRWGELSDGQRQRIILTAALTAEADLLALDEPTRALDPGARSEVFTLLRSLSRDKIIIVSTHDVDNLVCCDSVIALVNGRVKCVCDYGEAIKLVKELYSVVDCVRR